MLDKIIKIAAAEAREGDKDLFGNKPMQYEINPSQSDIHKALDAAVAALYFSDSSDYKSALYSVMRSLSPDIASLFESSESDAFNFTSALLAKGDV